ncbi:MAG: AI-2E family transporter [Verrucomicrobiaceae bacterium]|nr:MAG: AI-2E family transporter [Verrucomicrobiaceae bacterium]
MHPTPLQKKIFWAAITAVSAYAIGYVLYLVGSLIVHSISFLQPVLIPIAIAAILAFLLEPVVQWLMRRKLSRLVSIIVVYLAVSAIFAGILIWILPAAYRQGSEFLKDFPGYSQKAQGLLLSTVDHLHKLAENPLFKSPESPSEGHGQFTAFIAPRLNEAGAWLQQKIPDLAVESGKFLQRSLSGFFGVFGLLLSMILVPIFLFFFLKDSPAIVTNWSRYLPLRASPLKNEIVSLVSEINSYLVSFFRGQLLVSMIDGMMIACALLVMGLDFAVLIGLMVGILGLIPYLGMMITWIPAVIIAAAQFGDWGHPFWVTVIFLVANNIDGMVIAPKIVGDSVGLHPLTVIISVLAWSLILGGLLGALLAVPLTATLKVLLKRYFWDRPPSQATVFD